MATREEEYLRRMKALGYEPSLAGMDDEDIEWELSKMQEADRRREEQLQQPLRTVYRPVDPGLKARILRQFGQPYDESAIDPRESFYLNGWDNGEDEGEPPVGPGATRGKTAGGYYVPDDPWAKAWKLDWGKEGISPARPRTTGYRPERYETFFPNQGTTGNMLNGLDETAARAGVQLMSERANADTARWDDSLDSSNGGQGIYMPNMAGTKGHQEATETNNTQDTPKRYNQGWYGQNIWNSPEVLGAKTRKEREATINRIISSQAGEGLRRNYIGMHGGNETDAEITKNNDVKYIVDKMDFNDQYTAYVARMEVKGLKPLDRETKWEQYERDGTIEKQYLGSGVMLDMVDYIRKAAEGFKAAGRGAEATELERVAGECVAQVNTNPNWQEEKWLYDRMKDTISLTKMWQKAKTIPILKDPLGENKLGDTIKSILHLP